MGLVTTFQCDGCKRFKQEANHWWTAFESSGGFMIAALTDAKCSQPVYCSTECLQKRFSEYLTKTLEG